MQFLRTCAETATKPGVDVSPRYNLRRNEDRDRRGSRRLSTQGLAEEAARRDGRRRTRTSARRTDNQWTTRISRKAVAEGVAGGKFDRGILVCGTGVGMAIAANKVRRRALGADRRHRHREAVARAQRSQRADARRARAARNHARAKSSGRSCRRLSKAAATPRASRRSIALVRRVRGSVLYELASSASSRS